MKYKITYVPNSKIIEAIVEAETKEQAIEYWSDDNEEQIIDEQVIDNDDGYLLSDKL